MVQSTFNILVECLNRGSLELCSLFSVKSGKHTSVAIEPRTFMFEVCKIDHGVTQRALTTYAEWFNICMTDSLDVLSDASLNAVQYRTSTRHSRSADGAPFILQNGMTVRLYIPYSSNTLIQQSSVRTSRKDGHPWCGLRIVAMGTAVVGQTKTEASIGRRAIIPACERQSRPLTVTALVI